MPPDRYGPGQIAQMLGVAPRTVCKWIDNGELKGFRIPCSLHRRVLKADFDAFVARHKIALRSSTPHIQGD